jgi:hypothetical protein
MGIIIGHKHFTYNFMPRKKWECPTILWVEEHPFLFRSPTHLTEWEYPKLVIDAPGAFIAATPPCFISSIFDSGELSAESPPSVLGPYKIVGYGLPIYLVPTIILFPRKCSTGA